MYPLMLLPVAQPIPAFIEDYTIKISWNIPGIEFMPLFPKDHETICHNILGGHPVADIRHCNPDEIHLIFRIDFLKSMEGMTNFRRVVHGRICIQLCVKIALFRYLHKFFFVRIFCSE